MRGGDRCPTFLVLGVSLVLAFGIQCACEPLTESPPPADLVLRGARVLTLDEALPVGEALAEKGNEILAVGTRGEIQPLIGDETRVIELDPDNLVLPGLIHAHGHYMSLGGALIQLDLRTAGTWEEIVSLVEQSVAEAEPDVTVTAVSEKGGTHAKALGSD